MNALIYVFTLSVILIGASCSKKHDQRADLLAAIDSRDFPAVKSVAENGCDISSPDKWGYHFTPLIWAILYNDDEIALYLIAKGCDVNQEDIDGKTALRYALYGDGGDAKIDLVKQLIGHGSDVNHRDKTGNTILSYATAVVSGAGSNTISILIKNGAHL